MEQECKLTASMLRPWCILPILAFVSPEPHKYPNLSAFQHSPPTRACVPCSMPQPTPFSPPANTTHMRQWVLQHAPATRTCGSCARERSLQPCQSMYLAQATTMPRQMMMMVLPVLDASSKSAASLLWMRAVASLSTTRHMSVNGSMLRSFPRRNEAFCQGPLSDSFLTCSEGLSTHLPMACCGVHARRVGRALQTAVMGAWADMAAALTV